MKYFTWNRSLRKEGYSQAELDHLFSSVVLPSIIYGLPVYGAYEAELTAMQCFQKKKKKKKTTAYFKTPPPPSK